jgi:DNA-directed RNA polymerase beta' subunit
METEVTTPGRVMLAGMVPADMRDMLETPMDKKALRAFFTKLATDHPREYVDVMKKMTDLAADVSTEYGRWTSLSMKDLKLPPAMEAYRDRVRQKIHVITQSPSLTPQQKNDAVVKEMLTHIEPVKKMMEDEGVKVGNSFAISSKNGFRGNAAQLTQMLFGDIMMTDNRDRPIPLPMLHGYAEGLTPLETFAGSYGSRKAYSKVQFATADTGRWKG